MKRWLIRSGPGLGDTLVASALINSIRSQVMGVEIYFWCPGRYACLYERAPYQVVKGSLKHIKFDVFVNMSNKPMEVNALKKVDCMDKWWGLDTHQYVPKLFLKRLNLRYINSNASVYIHVSPRPSKRLKIGLCNMTKERVKLMPKATEQYLIESLLQRENIEVVFLAGKGFIGNDIEYEGVRVFDGDVKGLVNEIASCSLVISIDCGVMHLAAAMGKPTVAVFGPSDWRTWAPQGKNVRVVFNKMGQCSGCMKQKTDNPKCTEVKWCMERVMPGMILATGYNLLEEMRGVSV